jgi:hypothetical protein
MSRYDRFRRVVAPIALFVALALVARQACNESRTHATFALDFGAAEAAVRSVDVEVWDGGEQLATFHRAALPGGRIGPARFVAALPHDDGELRIAIELANERRRVVRRFHADEGAVITVPLGNELAPR